MEQLFNIFLLIFSPLVALLLFIFNVDKLMTKLFFKLYVFGMIITIPVIFFEQILISFAFFSGLILKLYISLIVCGFTEEFLKRFIVVSIANKDYYYKYKFSGILFSLFSALGFSTLENILFTFFNYQSYHIGYSRPLISSIGHILFAIIMGYYLSLSKYVLSRQKRRYYFRMSLLSPILLHGIFDFIINVEAIIILPIFTLIILILFFIYQRKLSTFYEEKARQK